MSTRYFSHIIGAGPSGLCCALNLAKNGVPFDIVEKNTNPPATNRAIGLHHETLDLLKQHDLYDPTKANSTAIHGSRIYFNNQMKGFIPFQDPENNFSINQQDLEKLLLEHLTTQYGTQIISEDGNDKLFSSNEENVILLCTGARDNLPQKLGFKRKTFPNDEVSFSCDCIIPETKLNHRFMHQMIYPDGRIVFTPLPQKNLFKVTGTYAFTNERVSIPPLQEIHQLIEDKTKITLDEIANLSLYRLQASQSLAYGKNNMFLVGDAGQNFLPHGAFGLNTAIQQAFHLSDLICQNLPFHSIQTQYHNYWKRKVEERLSISQQLAQRVSPSRLAQMDLTKEKIHSPS
ncbi:MAG: FAD-dependent monooxygenase [Alphaproteobacteria bacterium]|nr:FAD-dependent monooxygenase [Alphaproteobacteria bacterium]